MRRYKTDSGIYADKYDDAFLEIDDEEEYYDEYAEEMMDDGSESEEILELIDELDQMNQQELEARRIRRRRIPSRASRVIRRSGSGKRPSYKRVYRKYTRPGLRRPMIRRRRYPVVPLPVPYTRVTISPVTKKPVDGGAVAVTPETKYFKDSTNLKSVPLAPDAPIKIDSSWPSTRKSIARTYNRLGGLMQALSSETGIDIPAILAVWHVESGGRSHTPGRAIIRFENHLFYRHWGKNNESAYNKHFRHGGHSGQPGKSWQNHQFRESADQPFRSFHGDQDAEYRVLALARRLAGDGPALLSISIGGPQILISNYRLIGYSSPRAMYDAFQVGERAQVLGFFDFCRHKNAPGKGDLITHLRTHDWRKVAYYYNGSGQVEVYSGRLQNAYQHAQQLYDH